MAKSAVLKAVLLVLPLGTFPAHKLKNAGGLFSQSYL